MKVVTRQVYLSDQVRLPLGPGDNPRRDAVSRLICLLLLFVIIQLRLRIDQYGKFVDLPRIMADSTSSSSHIIEELGFPLSEHSYLLRLFSTSDPFTGLPRADTEASHSQIEYSSSGPISLTRRFASVSLRQDNFFAY